MDLITQILIGIVIVVLLVMIFVYVTIGHKLHIHTHNGLPFIHHHTTGPLHPKEKLHMSQPSYKISGAKNSEEEILSRLYYAIMHDVGHVKLSELSKRIMKYLKSKRVYGTVKEAEHEIQNMLQTGKMTGDMKNAMKHVVDYIKERVGELQQDARDMRSHESKLARVFKHDIDAAASPLYKDWMFGSNPVSL